MSNYYVNYYLHEKYLIYTKIFIRKKLVMSRKFVKNSFGKKIMIRLQINSRGFINCTRQWENPLTVSLQKIKRACLTWLFSLFFKLSNLCNLMQNYAKNLSKIRLIRSYKHIRYKIMSKK